MSALTEKDERRFFEKVGLPDADGCMPWLAAVTNRGYGAFALQGRVVPAHRVMHELMVGPIPAGLQIDHRCGNRECVAPAHLRIVSNKENAENLGGATRRSRSGVRGVYLQGNKWRAQIQHNGRNVHVGYFDSLEDAAAAARAARDELFTHNDRDRAAS